MTAPVKTHEVQAEEQRALAPEVKQQIVDAFHTLYYCDFKTQVSPWLGISVNKNPFDLWIYQEILFETKPTLIIETGSFQGGSAFFYATLFDLMEIEGRVVSIDAIDSINPTARAHPRIEFILGRTTDPNIIDLVRSKVGPGDKVMLTLDSCHTRDHVLNEMNIYHDLVTVGNYMVAEDGNICHPVHKDYLSGPYEAIDDFLKINDKFKIDKEREKFFMTYNPNGYMRRIK